MKTVWGERLNPNAVLQEYPRPQLRRESYVNLKREAKYNDDPDSYLRRKSERNKQIAKHVREIKKRRP